MDFNPNNRFILKAESIEVIENYEDYLLSSPSFSSVCLSGGGGGSSEENDIDKLSRNFSSISSRHIEYDHNDINGNNNSNDNDLKSSREVKIEIKDNEIGMETDGRNEEKGKEKVEKISEEEKIEDGKKLEKISSHELDEKINVKRKVKSFNMIVSHGDCVHCLPPDSLLLGSSISCVNEVYVTGMYGNILACQSHPEFHFEYSIKDRIWKAVVDLKNKLNDEELKIAEDSFAIYDRKDSDEFLVLIKSFLSRSWILYLKIIIY